MCIWDCESRTLKADLCSAAARQVRSSRAGCWQCETGCEDRSDGSEGPSAEIELADADRLGAAAAAKFEISLPANRSARPSRVAARMRPLLHSPARLRFSRCQIRLGEYPPPQIYPQGQQPAGQGETRH